ncbi:MAG TPA: formate dehydrogenase accessory protein FdhE [Chloroflexota bacterium]|nr:formate dehydrogenase accessory protein FdhE [Chloroflexota bacterium]
MPVSLEEVAAGDPNLRPYTELLAGALEAAREPLWLQTVTGLEVSALARLHAGEPVLHGAVLSLPQQALTTLYDRLRGAIPSPAAPGEGEGVGGLSLQALNEVLSLQLTDGPLATILQLALLPVLVAAAKNCAGAVAEAQWQNGICPVCAAWPALTESRGMDRLRMLRCGRCGSEWKLRWQLCPFCANDAHASLTYLYSDELGEARRVFACERCHGYLKTLATLSAIEPLSVAVQDLATLELDLAALDAGYQRPAEAGFSLDVQLIWQ